MSCLQNLLNTIEETHIRRDSFSLNILIEDKANGRRHLILLLFIYFPGLQAVIQNPSGFQNQFENQVILVVYYSNILFLNTFLYQPAISFISQSFD